MVLYRHKELRRHQYFCFPNWTGGLYVVRAHARPHFTIISIHTRLHKPYIYTLTASIHPTPHTISDPHHRRLPPGGALRGVLGGAGGDRRARVSGPRLVDPGDDAADRRGRGGPPGAGAAGAGGCGYAVFFCKWWWMGMGVLTFFGGMSSFKSHETTTTHNRRRP